MADVEYFMMKKYGSSECFDFGVWHAEVDMSSIPVLVLMLMGLVSIYPAAMIGLHIGQNIDTTDIPA